MCELGFKVLQLIFHRHVSSTRYAVCLLPYNRAQSVCHLDKLRTGKMAHHPWWNSIADERSEERRVGKESRTRKIKSRYKRKSNQKKERMQPLMRNKDDD